MNGKDAAGSVEVLYGRTGLRVRAAARGRARPSSASRRCRSCPTRTPRCATRSRGRSAAPPLADAGAGAQERLHPDLRHHAARCPTTCSCGRWSKACSRAGIPRDAITVLVATGLHRPNEGAELAELVGDPWVLADRARREPLRPRRRRARRPRHTPDARHAGQARPPLRRGGAAHRHRAGRAALHGRLLGRAQGGRPGRRARTTRSAPSTARASWRIPRRSSATSTAIRCTRSSSRSCACWARSTRSTRSSTRSATSSTSTSAR